MGVAMMANKNIICDPCRPCQSILCILNSIISLNLTDSLHSRLPQVPRCPDLAIFVSTTTTTMTAIMMMTEPIALPLVHARGVIIDYSASRPMLIT